jgi:drug/metabolite transporter (DMT)-like permease
MLAGRFAVAAALLWLLVLRSRAARMPRRTVAAGLLLGAAVYAPQSGLYFGAIARMDAGMAALVVYAYPAMVALAAAALGRERLSGRMVAALGASSAGVALVLLGSGAATADAVGVALALGAAAGYGAYVLISDGVVRDAGPLGLAALVTTGAGIVFLAAGAAGGGLPTGLGPGAWAWVLALALVSTVFPITFLLAAIRRLGPSSASVLSTFEPVVAAATALVAFGERLGPAQVLGALLVLSAVVILEVPLRRRRAARPEPAPA